MFFTISSHRLEGTCGFYKKRLDLSTHCKPWDWDDLLEPVPVWQAMVFICFKNNYRLPWACDVDQLTLRRLHQEAYQRAAAAQTHRQSRLYTSTGRFAACRRRHLRCIRGIHLESRADVGFRMSAQLQMPLMTVSTKNIHWGSEAEQSQQYLRNKSKMPFY